MQTLKHYALALILVFSSVVQLLEAVTVNPLAPMCPTNKIAPRRKRYNSHPRTFGEFYNLLSHNSASSVSDLQEKPQDDVPDDCGEIDDYDENDVGSVTQRPIETNRRQGYRFFTKGSSHRPSNHHLLNQHNHYGIKPTNRPTRPPPAGYFGTNTYTPPKPLEPSAYLKPVHEPGHEYQIMYRPGVIVGGPLGHVVGLPQKQGWRPKDTTSTTSTPPPATSEPKLYANHAYRPSTLQFNPNSNQHHRPRKYNGDTGILRSFVDLFF